MDEIIIKRNDEIICVCANKDCFYSDYIIEDMKNYGYKFYQNGKIYKI